MIFSDSLGAINNSKNPYNASDINARVQNLLKHANKNGNKIRICWIPGHCDVEENEMADQTSSKECSNRPFGNDRSVHNETRRNSSD